LNIYDFKLFSLSFILRYIPLCNNDIIPFWIWSCFWN